MGDNSGTRTIRKSEVGAWWADKGHRRVGAVVRHKESGITRCSSEGSTQLEKASIVVQAGAGPRDVLARLDISGSVRSPVSAGHVRVNETKVVPAKQVRRRKGLVFSGKKKSFIVDKTDSGKQKGIAPLHCENYLLSGGKSETISITDDSAVRNAVRR